MSYIWGLVLFLTLIPLTIAGCAKHEIEIQELEQPTNGQISSQPPATPPQPMDDDTNRPRGLVRRGVPPIPCRRPPSFTPPNPADELPPPP
ncbi:hypothetical protein TSUD_121030 [Trifolium subterraneum]|uniref:Uncharacterized protein n=1 Tax=Trifolium subterraneum TaxID=3900 RepID=A0A2Z6LTR7_TRISU|nr:hypothetical protein TSUD_121030 [Trifolium subterraneum]